MNKNLTLSIDEDLLDKARVLAAMRRTSVNEMVRGFLERETAREAEQAVRAAEWHAFFDKIDARATQQVRGMKGGLPSRDEMYDEAMRELGLL